MELWEDTRAQHAHAQSGTKSIHHDVTTIRLAGLSCDDDDVQFLGLLKKTSRGRSGWRVLERDKGERVKNVSSLPASSSTDKWNVRTAPEMKGGRLSHSTNGITLS